MQPPAPSSGRRCSPRAQPVGPRALVPVLFKNKSLSERTWGRAMRPNVSHAFLLALPGAGCEPGLRSLGRGAGGVGRTGWAVLVASSTPAGPRHPVHDDETQAHGHHQEAKHSEAKGLWGQGSGSGPRSEQCPQLHTSPPASRPLAPGSWGWTWQVPSRWARCGSRRWQGR